MVRLQETNLTSHPNNSNSTLEPSSVVPGGFAVSTELPIILLALLIVTANGTILFLFKRKRSLKTVTNYFLASLAVSDLMAGLFTIPLTVSCNATELDGVCEASVPFFVFSSLSTIAHIASITADRYIAILFALRYQALVTKSRARLVIAVIWLSSIFLSLVQLIWARPGEVRVNEEKAQDFMNKELCYTIIILLLVVIPLVFMVYAYVRIFVEILRQNKLARAQCSVGGGQKPSTHELRTVSMLVLMLLAYTFCWMPYAFVRLQNNLPEPRDLPLYAMHLILFLCFLTAFLNPCLYGFGKHDFRSALRDVLCKLPPRVREPDRQSKNQTTEEELNSTLL